MENNIILHKSLLFASAVVHYSRLLPPDSRVLATQLVRSGTAIGALVSEAQSAESRLDFVHKMKIADKEAEETLYWLNLLSRVTIDTDQSHLRAELDEIKRLLNSIILTCKRRR